MDQLTKGNGGGIPNNTDLRSKIKHKRLNSQSQVGDYDDDDDESSTSILHHDKNKVNNTSRNYAIACAFFASLNAVLLGYDIGVMSGAIIFIHEDLQITEVQEEVLVGCLSIVSLVGSLAGGRTSDAIGRKWGLAVGAIIFQIGGVIMTIAPSFQILMVGRLLAGIGIGFGAPIVGVYIAEISPAVLRGFLTSFPEVLINVGILLGYVSNYFFSGLPSNINWRVMLGLGILPSVIIAVAIFMIPESPRWLVLQNRVEEARLVLIRTIGDISEVENRLAEIIQQAASNANSMKSEEKPVWRELLRPNPTVRKMLITGIGIHCFQQVTGMEALVYYSPTIFKTAGIGDNSQLLAATVFVGLAKTFFLLIALFLIDRVGRKPLLYTSTIGMTMCMFCLAVSLAFTEKGPFGISLAILFVCGDAAFFSLGMGPICWVLNSEIYPLRLRAQAVSLGTVGNRLFSGVISLSFLSAASAVSVPGIFFVFSALSALSVVFVHYFVPETKGKTLEQIECLFQGKRGWKEAHLELADTERLVL